MEAVRRREQVVVQGPGWRSRCPPWAVGGRAACDVQEPPGGDLCAGAPSKGTPEADRGVGGTLRPGRCGRASPAARAMGVRAAWWRGAGLEAAGWQADLHLRVFDESRQWDGEAEGAEELEPGMEQSHRLRAPSVHMDCRRGAGLGVGSAGAGGLVSESGGYSRTRTRATARTRDALDLSISDDAGLPK
ncbi:uncharacterized protein BDZ99DRAFT_513667 [Mytilinidion resinicola]|uniref:Uncharacterized protein n=1 Tax=Mytilinidion resinicola TaxID=574789 RepID=A0A6A6Z8H7_9PEZI|nr:uncharacterized protein BDZ99DRAFT_513667 [Mytilinidion resinicola]KAF2817422.1 hypothetical protein BDZ99DRAFT_513667 [Mytilinidion resinicola]